MNENINKIAFEESKKGYLFFILIFIILTVGIFIFAFAIGSTIYGAFGAALLPFYSLLLISRFMYKWSFNPKFHIIPIVSIVLVIIAINSNADTFSIFISYFLNLVILMLVTPLASHTYTMACKYNKVTGLLKIDYDKLYFRTTIEYNIPPGSTINLHTLEKASMRRSGLFHAISVNNGEQIPIAPVNANGFGLIGKIFSIFETLIVNVDNVPKTNAKIVFPSINKIFLSIPKVGIPEGYYPIDLLQKIMGLKSYKKKYPHKSRFAIIKPILLLSLFFGFPILISTLIIRSLLGLIEPAPTDTLFYLIIMTLIIFMVGIIVGANFITVLIGKQSFKLEENYFSLNYNLLSKNVERKIHKAFNPLVRIEKNNIYLVILGNNVEIFYEHKMGKLDSDEMEIILSNISNKIPLIT